MAPRKNKELASWEVDADKPKPEGETRVRRAYCVKDLVTREWARTSRSTTSAAPVVTVTVGNSATSLTRVSLTQPDLMLNCQSARHQPLASRLIRSVCYATRHPVTLSLSLLPDHLG